MKERIISKTIKDYIKENDITKKEFAKRCKVSEYIIDKLMVGNLKVGSQKFLRVANVLNKRTNELVKDFLEISLDELKILFKRWQGSVTIER